MSNFMHLPQEIAVEISKHFMPTSTSHTEPITKLKHDFEELRTHAQEKNKHVFQSMCAGRPVSPNSEQQNLEYFDAANTLAQTIKNTENEVLKKQLDDILASYDKELAFDAFIRVWREKNNRKQVAENKKVLDELALLATQINNLRVDIRSAKDVIANQHEKIKE
jgi:hypothetical protein